MAKKRIISKSGLFGITYHYENSKYIGKSRHGLLGNREIHYDENGRQIGTSRPGALADEVHFDKKKKRFVSSYPGLVGKNHVSNGHPVGKTNPGIFDVNYTSFDNADDTSDFSLHNYFVCEEDFDTENDANNNMEITEGCASSRKHVAKKIIGILFAIETIFFLVMTVTFALKGRNIAPGVAALIISACVAFLCLKRTRQL